MQRPILKWNGFYLLFILGAMGLWWGFSLPHTLSSLHFLKPHSKCVSEDDCVVLGGGGGGAGGCGSHVSSARVSTEGCGGGDQQERTGTGQTILVKCTPVDGNGHLPWKKSVKRHSPATILSYDAILLATLCLLNMHFMLYLLLSSPSREQLALTLLASRAVQHCALYKSQQP